MSSKKVANGADMLYSAHLEGTIYDGYFRGNVGMDREQMIQRLYIRVLTEMAINRFKWINVPKEVDKRFIELTLFRNGLITFYKDKRFNKYMMLRATPAGYINAYDNPTMFQIVGPNFPTQQVYPGRETTGAGPAIPVWANALRVSDMDIVNIYAYRLAKLDRTIEINSENARQNKVVKGHRRNQLSHSNFVRAAEAGSNYIEVDGPLTDMQFIEVLDLAIDANMIDRLHILKVRQWNELMGLMGIGNANQDKKERLVEAEVGANDDQTDSMKYVSLNARQYACEQIREAYPDVEIWCEFNSTVREGITMPDFAMHGLEDEGYEPSFDDESEAELEPSPGPGNADNAEKETVNG